MKKLLKNLGTIILVLTVGFAITACDDDDENVVIQSQSVSYTGTANGETYTLKITENANRAAYTPVQGDSYVLTFTSKTSTGTVSSVTAGTFTLKPQNSETTFTATVSGTGLTNLSGTITLNDNETVEAPGKLIGVNGNLTEIEGGTIITGYWYLSPPTNVDLDTFVFAYGNWGEGLEGVIGSYMMRYKHFSAIDGSYEKLIAYKYFSGDYYGTLYFNVLDDNPFVVYIHGIDLAPGETLTVYGEPLNIDGQYAYKIKDMDGNWIDYD